MSSFLVAKPHIDLLVTAGLRLADDSPLTWKADPDVQGPTTLNAATADNLGSVLWSQNLASVRHTYGNDSHDSGGTEAALPAPQGFQDEQVLTYRFERIEGPLDPVAVLKAIDGFEYQASDHPDWPNSVAHRFCQALIPRLIEALPGYEQAPWVFSDRQYFHRATADGAAQDGAADVTALAPPTPGSPEPHWSGVVTDPAAAAAAQRAREPMLVAVIEWPSESGEEPTLIFGPTPQALDRAVIGVLRDETSYGLPGYVEDELGDFVRDNPLPAADAPAEDNQRWLTAMRTALISTSVTLYTVPPSGRANAHEHAGRYLNPSL